LLGQNANKDPALAKAIDTAVELFEAQTPCCKHEIHEYVRERLVQTAIDETTKSLDLEFYALLQHLVAVLKPFKLDHFITSHPVYHRITQRMGLGRKAQMSIEAQKVSVVPTSALEPRLDSQTPPPENVAGREIVELQLVSSKKPE
jgi:hypothetical protein